MKNNHVTNIHRKIIKVTVLTTLFLSLILNIFLIYEGHYISRITNFIKYEKRYSAVLSSYTPSEIHLDNNDEINFVCIGNSITLHPICDYWWEERGMASTSIDTDYVHLLSSFFANDFSSVSYNAINFSDWEKSSWDRAETLRQINSYLNTNIDLVIIQLGENANDISTLEKDFNELITYCADRTNGASIIVLGEFWKDPVKDLTKINACKETGATFVSLREIQTKEYQCGLNTQVLDSNMNYHAVTHNGVAHHPNDKAFQYMASKIYNLVK